MFITSYDWMKQEARLRFALAVHGTHPTENSACEVVGNRRMRSRQRFYRSATPVDSKAYQLAGYACGQPLNGWLDEARNAGDSLRASFPLNCPFFIASGLMLPCIASCRGSP